MKIAKMLSIATASLVIALLIVATIMPGSIAFAQSGTQNGNMNFDTMSCSAALSLAQQFVRNPSGFKNVHITQDQANRLMVRCPNVAAFVRANQSNLNNTNGTNSSNNSTTSSSSSTNSTTNTSTTGTNNNTTTNMNNSGVSNIGGAGSPATAPTTGADMNESGLSLMALAGLVILGAGLALNKAVLDR